MPEPTAQSTADSRAPSPTLAPSNSNHSSAKETTQKPAASTTTREDGAAYPTGARLGLIILALCLAVFLMALDNSIIATAIPKITDHFHSLDDVGWYGSAYMLTTAALQLLFGKFYTVFSIKWTFLGAIALFELGSLVCGVAQSSVALILGRAVAGLGSAGLFSGALVILAYSVPLAKRPMYGGLVGSMYGIASVAGPLLGGVFTDKVTWRWCFLINLPIGAVALVTIGVIFEDPDRRRGQPAATVATVQQASETLVDEKKKKKKKEKETKPATVSVEEDAAATAPPPRTTLWETLRPFDPVGSLLFMPAIISLLLALQWGGTTYAWGSGRIIALLVVFAVLISLFVAVQHAQHNDNNATVPPRIIRQRSMWAAAWYSFTMGAAFLSSIYYLPIWFQAVKGASAVRSGLMNLPMLISLVLVSIVAGAAVTALGYYAPFMVAGAVVMPIGYGLISTFTPATGHARWIGYQVLAGAGAGLGMQQPLMAVQTVLAVEDVAMGTSVIVFVQTLGGALFVSVAQNIFTNYLATYVRAYVPGLDPSVVLGTGATSIQQTISADQLAGVTLAYSQALVKTFLASTALSAMTILGAVCIEWKSVKGKKVEVGLA